MWAQPSGALALPGRVGQRAREIIGDTVIAMIVRGAWSPQEPVRVLVLLLVPG